MVLDIEKTVWFLIDEQRSTNIVKERTGSLTHLKVLHMHEYF